MAASVASSIDSLEHPSCVIARANEGQCPPGLVVQPVALGAPHNMEGPAQWEPAQEQGVSKVGWHAVHVPTRTWWSALLTWRNALIMVIVYLAVASMNYLAPVASRVIRCSSAWNRPVLSAVMMVCPAWT